MTARFIIAALVVLATLAAILRVRAGDLDRDPGRLP